MLTSWKLTTEILLWYLLGIYGKSSAESYMDMWPMMSHDHKGTQLQSHMCHRTVVWNVTSDINKPWLSTTVSTHCHCSMMASGTHTEQTLWRWWLCCHWSQYWVQSTKTGRITQTAVMNIHTSLIFDHQRLNQTTTHEADAMTHPTTDRQTDRQTDIQINNVLQYQNFLTATSNYCRQHNQHQ